MAINLPLFEICICDEYNFLLRDEVPHETAVVV